MPAHSPIQTPSFGRTFVVSATLLAAIAVIQLGGLTVAFVKKMGTAGDGDSQGPPLKIDVNKLIAESPPPDDPPGFGPDPLSTGSNDRAPGWRPVPIKPDVTPGGLENAGPGPATSVPPPLSSGGPPRPTPVPLSVFTPKID